MDTVFVIVCKLTLRNIFQIFPIIGGHKYHALIQKKIAAENALKVLISEEAWRRYLELDAISNELESVRLEAMYLAGAADHEKLSK